MYDSVDSNPNILFKTNKITICFSARWCPIIRKVGLQMTIGQHRSTRLYGRYISIYNSIHSILYSSIDGGYKML